jgi:hypothetical protein
MGNGATAAQMAETEGVVAVHEDARIFETSGHGHPFWGEQHT